MSSSSDFEGAPPISKSPNTASPKKGASSSYLPMLNANNKFNEMLKNKIQQTGVSPLLKYDFNPVASSTQIGTPNELKRKSATPKKKVVVKKEPLSFESSDENITKVRRTSAQKGSKRGNEEPQTVSSLTLSNQSKKSAPESSADSESDSQSSAPSSPRTKCNKETSAHGHSGNRSKNQTSSDESSVDEGTPTVMSKEPVRRSNLNINFSKFSKSDNEPQNLSTSLSIKREMHSNVGHDTKKKKHKDKHKTARKPSTESSDDENRSRPTDAKAGPSGQERVSNKKTEKNKQKVPPTTSSSSSSESEARVPVRTGRENDTDGSSDSSSQKHASNASNKSKTKHKKHAMIVENGDRTSSSGSESEAEPRIEKAGKIRKRQAECLSEDDNESVHQTKKAGAARLRKLEKEESLEPVSTSFDVLNISSKEDVYIIQIPVKLDPKRLIGSSISLNGSVRFNKKYDSIISQEGQESIAVCTNNDTKSLKVIKPIGTIKLQRRLRYQKAAEVPELINKTVEFPSNLKSRHPLFGSDFGSKIDLDEHVKMKLDSLCEPNSKKKKKKKKKEVQLESTQDQQEEIFKFLTVGTDSSASSEKKKKKKKSEDHDLQDRDESISKKRKHSPSDCLPAKKIKKKQEEDSNDSLIQEMLLSQMATLDMTKKKKKKKKKEC